MAEDDDPPAASSDSADTGPANSVASSTDSSESADAPESSSSAEPDAPAASSSSSAGSGDDGADLTEDDVTAALTDAFAGKGVDLPDNAVGVTRHGSSFHLNVRVSATAKVLPQVPSDTSGLAPRSVEGAALMVIGSVHLVGGEACQVNMRLVVVETSRIVETASGRASGVDKTAVESAALDAISGLATLTG